jgi:uncharacterized protein (TIGR02271 family)
MARVPLSQLADWKVVDEGQEIRGLRLIDQDGETIGLIHDLVVDTDAGYVDSILLDTGQEIPVDDIEIAPGIVVLQSSEVARAATTGDTVERVGGLHVPVIEEHVRIGKQRVEGDGVRVTTEVENLPVSENVTLRHETMDVQRNRVRKPIAEGAPGAFREGTYEVRARAEEVTVGKRLFVVEEIHIKKDAVERTETIRDTVRRTNVRVEELPGRPRPAQAGESGTAGEEGVSE